jgi:heme exporter protein C
MGLLILGLGVLSAAFLAFSQYLGLFVAPPDRMMGDLYRILYVHVPAAWMTMVFFFLSFIGSVGYLIRKKDGWDRFAWCTAEIGVVLNALALALGSLWGKPVWGVWWTWDPRLTTTALLFVMYGGYLILRRLITDEDRRAKISAATGLLIFLNVPIVYMSVKWWRSLHQMQSSPETVDPSMVLPLRLNALALLAISLVLLVVRLRLAKRTAAVEAKEAMPPERRAV